MKSHGDGMKDIIAPTLCDLCGLPYLLQAEAEAHWCCCGKPRHCGPPPLANYAATIH